MSARLQALLEERRDAITTALSELVVDHILTDDELPQLEVTLIVRDGDDAIFVTNDTPWRLVAIIAKAMVIAEAAIESQRQP